MRKTLTALAMALALNPLSAGEPEGDHPKCQAEAKACLTAMAHKLDHKGWVGIEMVLDASTQAIVVRKVIEDSPAAAAGFLVGDVLAALNGTPYTQENRAALKRTYAGLVPGDAATYTVIRGGVEVELEVKLAEIPETLKAQWIGKHMLENHADAAEREEGGKG
jgi:C-terminal processing protease CtpA/Prc